MVQFASLADLGFSTGQTGGGLWVEVPIEDRGLLSGVIVCDWLFGDCSRVLFESWLEMSVVGEGVLLKYTCGGVESEESGGE